MRMRRESSTVNGKQAGYVTAETAVVLPVLVIVLVALLWILALASAHTRASDIAVRTARAAARGDSVESLRAAAHASVPEADVDIEMTSDLVVVRVRWSMSPPVAFLSAIGTQEIRSDATARREVVVL
jgi:hypothetical protein